MSAVNQPGRANRLRSASAWLRKAAAFLAGTSLPEIVFVSSFIFSRYLINADFSYPSEVIIPILLFAVLVSITFYLYRLVLRSQFAAHVAALPLAYAFYSYSYLPHWIGATAKFLLPGRFETGFILSVTVFMVVALLSGLGGWAVNQLVERVSFLRQLQPYKIVLFIVAFIFVTQLIKVGIRIGSIYDQLSYQHPVPALSRSPGAQVKKPDIYYFVFDRYANSQTLNNIYNYDNSKLTDYLGAQGFVTNNQAYANYPFTMQSITSTLAMQYHTDLEKQFGKDSFQTAFPYRTMFNNPPVAQVLKANGYTYNQVSSWWDFTRINIQADNNPTESFRLRVFGKSFFLSDLARDIVNKSILSPWLIKGIAPGNLAVIKYDRDNNPKQNFYQQMSAVKAIASHPSSAPQFTFAHFLAPHDPYIFTADGSDPAYDGNRDDNGIDETQKYTNEITYLNTQIESMMSSIRQHSPSAVIIIQSDEGPYPKDFRFALTPGHYYDPSKLALPQMKQKFGVLASYYMPGIDPKTVQSQLNSSVNAFRFVLQHYLGYNIGMLPACQFSSGDKYVLYDYTPVTDKLTPPASPLCKQYQ